MTTTILMLSHCVPAAAGSADRVRAWRLLRLARQTHRVVLACRCDGPLHLSQWRQLQRHADRMVIEPRRIGRELCGGAVGLMLPGLGSRLAAGEPSLCDLYDAQAGDTVEAVLCTTPALYPHAARLDAPTRFVDATSLPARSYRPRVDDRDVIVTPTAEVRDAWCAAGYRAAIVPDAPLLPEALAAELPWSHSSQADHLLNLTSAPGVVFAPSPLARAA